MTPRPLIALLGVIVLGLPTLTAEVPVDEPVAIIDTGLFSGWLGSTGNAVHIRSGSPAGVWTIPYTPEGPVGSPASSPVAEGYNPIYAGDNKALLDKDRYVWTSSAFRVMRLSDGAILSQLTAPFQHLSGSPRHTAGGLVAVGQYGTPAGLHFLSYPRGADSPEIRPMTLAPGSPAPSLLAVAAEWLALWGTDSQIGNHVVTIHRLSDLTETRRITIPWQEGFEAIAAAHGDLLYFRTRNEFRCLDVTTGTVAPVFNTEDLQSYRNYQAINADAGGLWFLSPVELELRHYRGNPAQGFQLVLRGKIPWQPQVPSGEIHLSQGRVHLVSSSRIWVFDPLASRPRLLPPSLPPVREMDAVIPLPLALDRAPDRELSIRFRTAGGSATPGLDYEPVDQVVTFPAGSRTAQVPLRLLSDQVAESAETITFEATDPDGIRLPTTGPLGLVIVSSGMETREMPLMDSAGVPVPWGGPTVVLPNVMLGRSGNHPNAHLWDRRTGALRGVTDIPADTELALETPDGLEVVVTLNGAIEIVRINPANGATLARREVLHPYLYGKILLLGGGRIFVSYSNGGGTLFGRIYSLDDPATGVDFPLFGGTHPGFFSAVSDGHRLAIGWEETGSGLNLPPGPKQHVRWYSADTLELEGEMDLNTRPSLRAIRGDLLLGDGVFALDLARQRIAWQHLQTDYLYAVGDTHMLSYTGVLEIATGLKVADGVPVGSRLPGGSSTFLPSSPASGPGGIVYTMSSATPVTINGIARTFRTFDFRADRQAPGLEWLGTQLRPDEEQARMPLRTCEPSSQSLTASFALLNAAPNPNDPRQIAFGPAPATVPGDGKIRLHDFHAPPGGLESLLYPTTHSIEVRVDSPGAVPLVRSLTMRREESTAPLPDTRVDKLPAIAALNPPRFQMRYADGRIVLATGTDYPDVDPDGKVYILDAATGNLLFSMSDPTPMYRRAFAMDATVQGNKLLVLVRHVPTGVRTGEIYDIPSRALLGTVADPASGKTFPSYLDASATHFALGAATLAWWDQKSTIAVFQWSDFKRVFQKSGRAGGGLGNGVDLKVDRLFAGISGSKPNDVGLIAQAVGAKIKLPKVPKGMGGQVIPGDPLLYILDRNGATRAYDPATYREAWSVPEKITGAIRGTARDFAWTLRDRDLSLLDAVTGKRLATSRVSDGEDRPYTRFTAVVASPDRLYLKYRDRLLSIAPADLGDFADTRRWKNLPPVLASPDEDLDGNGQADFAEYIVRRLPPGGSLGSVRIEGGQVVVEEGATPPVDLASIAEVEVASGWWYPVAWRDGISPWVTRPLPAGSSGATPLRVRHLPHPTLGWFPPLLSWPPLAVAIGGDDSNALPAPAANLAARLLASSAGDFATGPESQPLRLGRSGSGWAVEYLRLLDEADPARLESSTDLIVWTPVADEPPFTISTAPAGPGMEKVVLTVEASDTRRFFRLRR